MEKGKGKCIVCGCDEIAKGIQLGFYSHCDDLDDYKYFENVTMHACTNCGFIQFTSDYSNGKEDKSK